MTEAVTPPRCPKCRRSTAPEFALCYYHAWKDRVRRRAKQGIKKPGQKWGRPMRMPDAELERLALTQVPVVMREEAGKDG